MITKEIADWLVNEVIENSSTGSWVVYGSEVEALFEVKLDDILDEVYDLILEHEEIAEFDIYKENNEWMFDMTIWLKYLRTEEDDEEDDEEWTQVYEEDPCYVVEIEEE